MQEEPTLHATDTIHTPFSVQSSYKYFRANIGKI